MKRKRLASINRLIKQRKGPEASFFELIERSTGVRYWVVMSSWSYVPCDTPREAKILWRSHNAKPWQQKNTQSDKKVEA